MSRSTSDGNILHINKRSITLSFIALLIIITLSAGFYLFTTQPSSTYLSSNQSSTDLTLEQIGKLIELPANEKPSIETITNIDKYKDHPLYQKTQLKDLILTFPTSQKLIIYRPSTNKIIEASYINNSSLQVNSPPSSPSALKSQPQPTPIPKDQLSGSVTLLNGTKIAGLAQKTQDQLEEDFPKISEYKRGNAKNDYTKTLVVEINSQTKQLAQEIAKSLKAELSTLPAGEDNPQNTDILILLGQDRR